MNLFCPGTLPRFKSLCLALGLPFGFSALGKEQVVATYQGGEITQEQVDSWVAAIGEKVTSRIPIYQIQSLAVAKYLAERTTLNRSDPSIAIQARRFRAAAVRSYYTKDLFEQHRPTAAQIDGELEKLKDQFGKPERARLRNIFKTKKDKTGEEVDVLRDQMEEIRSRLVAGADFQALALKESDSANRFDGGKIGNISHDNIREDVADRVFQLKKGEISAVLETEDGFHIFLCEEMLDPVVVSEDEKRRRIEKFLHKQSYDAVWDRQREAWMHSSVLNHEAIQKGAGNEIALTLPSGETFSAAEVRTLLRTGIIPVDPTRDLPTSELILQRLNGFIVDTSAAGLYLDSHPMPEEVDRMIHWKELQILSDREIALRLEKSPPPDSPTDAELRELYERTKNKLATDQTYRLETFSMRIEQGSLRNDAPIVEKFRQSLAATPSILFVEAAKSLPAEILARSVIRTPQEKTRKELFSMAPGLSKVISTLKPGGTSPVFQTRSGKPMLWIVRLIDVQESRPITFEEARQGLITFLIKQRSMEQREKIQMEILSEMKFHHVKGE